MSEKQNGSTREKQAEEAHHDVMPAHEDDYVSQAPHDDVSPAPEEVEIEVMDSAAGLPIDRGWAWMVLFGE